MYSHVSVLFFFNDTATTEIYTLSLHDALPIYEEEVRDKKTNAVMLKRHYASIPLNVAIDRQKKGLSTAPEDENGNVPIFVLSPNDLVYLPTAEDIANASISFPINKNRIYKMRSEERRV